MTRIENSTGFLVVRTARQMKRALDNRLNPIGVTAAQHTILSILAKDDGLPLSEVGKRVFLDKPAITGLADRLEHDELVERRRSKTDRRVVELYLTPKGRDLLEEMDSIAVKVDRELVSVLEKAELEQFRNTLIKIWNHSRN